MLKKYSIEVKELEFLAIHAINYCMLVDPEDVGYVRDTCRRYYSEFSEETILKLYEMAVEQENKPYEPEDLMKQLDWEGWEYDIQCLLDKDARRRKKKKEQVNITSDALGTLLIYAFEDLLKQRELNKFIKICRKCIPYIYLTDIQELIDANVNIKM